MRTFLLVVLLLAIVLLCGASFVVRADGSAHLPLPADSATMPLPALPPSAVVMLAGGVALVHAGFSLRRG